MKINFVLVEPAVPENIGAAARAIKTMGFNSLWIVNSKEYQKKEAKYLAHGANDILDSLVYFSSFHKMMQNLDFSIATTAKARRVRYDYMEGKELPEFLIAKKNIVENVGVIFGREEYGLRNEEINQCDITSSIPLSSPYPSLNLSQAVMLFAYLLSPINNLKLTKTKEEKVDSELEALKEKIKTILPHLDMGSETNIHGRIFERLMHAEQDDIHILHSLANKIMEKISGK
jgi:tRNA/rRNA methyltransferase